MSVDPSEPSTTLPVNKERQRRGNIEKCPVCGSGVDPEAYCCPSCKNYFCYHCRARVLPRDPQFQCVNQSCDYYGRLICDVCDPHHQKEEKPSLYLEPEDGFWLLLFPLSLLGGLFAWFRWQIDWRGALAAAAVCFFALALIVRLLGRTTFGRHRKVEQKRVTTFHTCISCGEPVRQLEAQR